jgi:hypothetical protein
LLELVSGHKDYFYFYNILLLLFRMEMMAWETTNVNNKPEELSSSTEREARSIALEKAYVHDVYQQIASHFSDARYRAWPKVKQFLLELEPGSIVCDVGE